MIQRRAPAAILAAGIVLLLGVTPVWSAPQPNEPASSPAQDVIVELNGPAPTAVAAHAAARGGLAFSGPVHDMQILRGQDEFLVALRSREVQFETPALQIRTPVGDQRRTLRFTSLINAMVLTIPKAEVARIRAMGEVRHVTPDIPKKLDLDTSVEYIRASDGPGSKTIFTQGGGAAQRFDGTGQVIAVIDTGIDSSHPQFDTRFTDSSFTSRTGDTKPVRAAGSSYNAVTHHPKVVYYMNFGAGAGDPDGHGTAVAANAAGLMVNAPGDDGILGNGDDRVIEGVAPGALLMSYPICAPSCPTSSAITAMEDAVSPQDSLGNPKPVATAINMSFSGGGDPDDALAVAATNAASSGAVIVASAGNGGSGSGAPCTDEEDCENTIGSPSSGRGVLSVAATYDPGDPKSELDVLVKNASRYTTGSTSTGAQNDSAQPVAPEDRAIAGFPMEGSPALAFALGQHYVYAGTASTSGDVPNSVSGRIALAIRGGGTFAQKAANVAAKGAVALLVYNDVGGELDFASAAGATIPVLGLSKLNGEYLRFTLGFDVNGLSQFPLRLGLPTTFSPQTVDFSSRGPVDDYSVVKPDLTAPGYSVYAGSSGALGGATRYAEIGGTSFSSPHVTGSAALTRHALLSARGSAPISATDLRSGAGAAQQQAQNLVTPVSHVRSALVNRATNLRQADGETQVPNSDDRTFIHEIGSGLAHVKRATDARVALGSNVVNANGLGGPDAASDPNFLSTYSFGQNEVIGSGIQSMQKSVTLTLENTFGAAGAGTYTLSLVEGGAPGEEGDVTKPFVGTTGFSVILSQPSVTLTGTSGNQATFTVTTTVDGRSSPTGLAIAGTDDTGEAATEFLWWVVGSGSNGQIVRMPFYYRAVEGFPFLAQPQLDRVKDDSPADQQSGVDRDGNYRLEWDFPSPPVTQPCQFRIEHATGLQTPFIDNSAETLSSGDNAKWIGDSQWRTGPHPGTSSRGYTFSYNDQLDIDLAMRNSVSLPAGQAAQLTFDSFEDIEEGFDFGYVEASTGGAYQTLTRLSGSFSGARTVDLSQFAGQSVRIRFRFVSDAFISAPGLAGWSIDNVKIEAAAFTSIGPPVPGSASSQNITGASDGAHYYRVTGLFFNCPAAPTAGPPSAIRRVIVDLPDPPQRASPYWSGWDIARDIEFLPGTGFSGYVLDGWGSLHAFGEAPPVTSGPYWPNQDLARGFELLSTSNEGGASGYVLDSWGGVHPFAAGNHSPPPPVTGGPYWRGWNIARDLAITGPSSGYVLDGFGGVHRLGAAPAMGGSPYFGFDIARDLEILSSGKGYVLDGFAGVHPMGGAIRMASGPYWQGWDIARDLELTGEAAGLVLDGWGGVHRTGEGPIPSGGPHFAGWDIANDLELFPSAGGQILDGWGARHNFNVG